MRITNFLMLALIVIGGLDWLLIGLFQFDPIGLLLGGPGAVLARIAYTLIGVSVLWQTLPLFSALHRGDAEARLRRNNDHQP